MNKYIKKIVGIFIIFTFIILVSNYSNANIIEENKGYTEDYIRWMNLSESEKKNYIQPRMYSIPYNVSDNKAQIYALQKQYPDRYCLLDDINISMKNQMNTGSCWAFSVTTMIESNMSKMRNKNITLSPRHIEYSTSKSFSDGINKIGFNREVGDGGNAAIGLAYATSGYGPVLESAMPFRDSEARIKLSEIANKKVAVKIDDYVELPSIYKEYDNDGSIVYTNGYGTSTEEEIALRVEYTEEQVEQMRNKIKEQISKYGAVASYTYANGDLFLNTDTGAEYAYFSSEKNLGINHAVTIIGWDDNYSKDNFSSLYKKPSQDGAYIVQNSWGNNWSRNGYYYISYEDNIIERNLCGVIKTEDVNYENIYQYDELGTNSWLVYKGGNSCYAGNVFKNKTGKVEELKEVGFYINNNCDVEIYVNSNDGNLNKAKYVTKKVGLEPGFHTIKLNNSISIKNDKYGVVIKYITSGNNLPSIPYEARIAGTIFDTAKGNVGESYIKSGNDWYDLYASFGGNISLKAYTTTNKSLSKVAQSINTSNKTYTGKNIETSIVLKDGRYQLKKGTDYTVTYKNNKNTGKATVTITGKGKYTGTITKTFKIVPKKVTLSSVKNTKGKKAKITWKKDTQANGYEVYMATSKNGKYSKVTTVTKNKTVTYTKTKLKKNKKYYFKVRSYKTIDGKKVYGSYSSIKNITIKK